VIERLTEGIPPVLLYLATIVLWSLFDDAFTGTVSPFAKGLVYLINYIPCT